MRTIQKILRYNFSEEQKHDLYEKGIINGCGGKGGINFEKIMYQLVTHSPRFLEKKSTQLFADIKELCLEHDYDFSLGGKFDSYLKANYYFARGIFFLTYWTNFFYRIVLFFCVFFLLSWYGTKYYNFK